MKNSYYSKLLQNVSIALLIISSILFLFLLKDCVVCKDMCSLSINVNLLYIIFVPFVLGFIGLFFPEVIYHSINEKVNEYLKNNKGVLEGIIENTLKEKGKDIVESTLKEKPELISKPLAELKEDILKTSGNDSFVDEESLGNNFDTLIVPASKTLDFIEKNKVYFYPKDRNELKPTIDYIGFYANKEIKLICKVLDKNFANTNFNEADLAGYKSDQLIFVKLDEESIIKQTIRHNAKYAFVQNKVYTTSASAKNATTTADLDRITYN